MNIETAHAAKTMKVAKTVKDLGLKTRAAVTKSGVSQRSLARGVATLTKKSRANADIITITTSPQKQSSNPSTDSCELYRQMKHEMSTHQWMQSMPQFPILMTLRKSQS